MIQVLDDFLFSSTSESSYPDSLFHFTLTLESAEKILLSMVPEMVIKPFSTRCPLILKTILT